MSKKVVVKTTLTIESRQGGLMFAARLKGLGLTGYGRTHDEAKESVKALFKQWVDGYRQLGVLAERLDCIGAEWCWYDEYQDSAPIEDVALGVQQAASAAPLMSVPISMAMAA